MQMMPRTSWSHLPPGAALALRSDMFVLPVQILLGVNFRAIQAFRAFFEMLAHGIDQSGGAGKLAGSGFFEIDPFHNRQSLQVAPQTIKSQLHRAEPHPVATAQ